MKRWFAVLILNFSFISNALAHGTPGGHSTESGLMSVLPMLVIFVAVFYFLLIRPQNKRAKEHRKLIETISKGDEVVTSGGMLGQVKKADEHYVELEIADNVAITIQKGSVTAILPKGTIKSI